MDSVADIARLTTARHGLLPEDAPVLALVSGGGDSVALLHLLASGELGAHPLRVLHVNHLLRGGQADEDEAFVVRLCELLGIECAVARFDVGAWAAEEGLNLEDAGRRVRYRFADEELDAWCGELGVRPGVGRIAVAHTRDDRVETFFMRAIAGAGPAALASIAHRRDRVVRPLLDCDRAAVRAWLESAGHVWREDASNHDTDRARAFVRAHVIPEAERLNTSVRESLARTIDLLADENALLTGMASSFARDFVEVEPGQQAVFDKPLMSTLDKSMARRTIREALIRAFPETSRLEASHIEALVEALQVDSFARDLPSGISARIDCDTLVVSRPPAEPLRMAPGLLNVPGNADLGAAGSMTAEEVSPHDTSGDDLSVVIDATRIDAALTVDAVRAGDRMRPLGMEGTKKLSDLLIDAKVRRERRGLVPVVRDGERIVWLAGVRMSEEYRVGADTARAVRLTWSRDVADGRPTETEQ
jgi:tRNA(Ile)-lysidine synthase